MDSRIKVLGHPVHQMLVVFPMGLLATGVIFDIIYLIKRNPTMATVAYWMILAGIIGGAIAAPFGFADWRAIPANTRAKRVGVIHGLGNVLVLILFGLSVLGRTADPTHMVYYVLSFAGFALAGVTGWLGGELVDRLGVGVDSGAHLDSPNSLSGRPAQEHAR